MQTTGLAQNLRIACIKRAQEWQKFGLPHEWFLQLVQRDGARLTLKRLLQDEDPNVSRVQEIIRRRPELAIESLILLPQFKELFTEQEREIATARLGLAQASSRAPAQIEPLSLMPVNEASLAGGQIGAQQPQSPQSSAALVVDSDQQGVIEAAADRLLLVTAPPGAGKTAVACARIAWLARQGLPPSSILMISFTRVAVAEFRDRVERMAADIPDIRGVEITTLDAHTWRILKGLAEDKKIEELFGSYDANIESTARRIRDGDPGITEWIQHFRYIIVDEGQDLIGARAELVAAILRARAPGTGATIFADEAQAIYGFTPEEDNSASSSRSLFDVLAQYQLEPERLELRTIHRTNNPRLRQLFLESRLPLVGVVAEPRQAWSGARDRIRELADADVGGFASLVDSLPESQSLVLFRTRAEVLRASSWLHYEHGIAHRVRMSGLPQVIEPWIGFLLGDWTESTLTQDDFFERWHANSRNPCVQQSVRTAECAWEALKRLALGRRGHVDISRLRVALSRSRAPVEVAVTDIGVGGPILGTIHASKGREADDVILMMPRDSASGKTDHLEEGRILYVGATRARKRLRTGESFSYQSKKVWSGRSFGVAEGKLRVEIGRDGDVDSTSPVSRNLQRDAEQCRLFQQWLAERALSEFDVEGFSIGHADWDYRICIDKTRQIGKLTQQVNTDLFAIGRKQGWGEVRLPETLKNLWCAGATTVCLPPDSPHLEKLHEPYSRSGFFLAPVIRGFPVVYFSRPRQKRNDW